MTLAVAVRHRQGDFSVDAAFESRGRLIALFGPSGAGKSTLVNVIAGLVRPQSAKIAVDGTVLVDTDHGVEVPVHRRRIGYVFQDARLFPHLTVAQNLGYGRYFSPADERRTEPAGIVDMLGIGHLLQRRPARLSGGERQRVAIGRALLAAPRLLLMDEPLAALDDARKAEILPYIERLRDEAGVPIVYVSHSIAEVARLATDVVLMDGGRTVACGPAADILSRSEVLSGDDRNEAGVLVDITVERHQPDGLTILVSSAGEWRLPAIDAGPGTRLRARVRARDVMLAVERPSGISALNVFFGRVDRLDASSPSETLVSVVCGGDRIIARITNYSVRQLSLAVGNDVFVIVKAATFADGNRPHSTPKGE